MKLGQLALCTAVALGTFALSACQQPKEPTQKVESAAVQKSPSEQINELVQTYFDQNMARNPVYATFVGQNQYNDQFNAPISAEQLASDRAFEEQFLAQVNAIDASKLTGQDWLTYEIFKRDRELSLRGMAFNAHMLPLSQMGGVHSYFAMLGSGSSAQPFNNEQDYRNFIKRSEGFAVFMDSVIAAMKDGVEAGMVLPKPIVAKLLPQLSVHAVENVSESVFYGPVNKIAELEGLSDEQRQALTTDYTQMIEQVIIPAYAKAHDYLRDEYTPHARDSVGLSDLPNGADWYAHQIDSNTTLPLTAEEIHQFGQDEVARILSEMNKVRSDVQFEGDLQAFFTFLREDDQFYFDSEEAVIKAYTDIKQDIDGRLPALFEVFPKADYEVRAVEAYRAASSAGASYQSPAPDGSRPGIFYINTHNLKAQPKFLMETLSVHEAAPGHHFQIAIQQEVEGLPAFRKFGGYTVFAEGWALYAESLGKEMGLFSDPYMWYGRLADEQLRAMRLVVDTGLHAYGWSREKAIEFMLTNSSMAESDVVAEVERYISIPGQALSYKVGERHIRMLRNKAAEVLGDKFDVRKFHTQILIDGALPMPILEAKIDKWIAAQAG